MSVPLAPLFIAEGGELVGPLAAGSTVRETVGVESQREVRREEKPCAPTG